MTNNVIIQEYPKVLILSHNCFSKSGSNGRTLANFFQGWPVECLAQFYIHNEIPDSPVCNNYFRVLDTEAIQAFIKGKKVGRKICANEGADTQNKHTQLNSVYKQYFRRSSINYTARNIIWNSSRWRSLEFSQWVNDFSPQVVLLQAGDYEFMYKIALDIAQTRNIPLVIYNSEDYYFKDQKSLSPLYHIYRYKYKKQFEKTMEYATYSIYNSDMLQETYNKHFKHKSTVIMTATEITRSENKNKNKHFIISYLGNLGVGRHESLVEIANTLQNIDETLRLDIYGKIPNEVIESRLKSCSGINYKGFINYDEVVNVLKSSDLLVHAENFSKFHQWDLKHAFSTKIADSLASGTCFFVYAPENMACVKYLQNNKSACVITEKKELSGSLRKLINDKELRQSYIDTALQVANSMHNIYVNAECFKDIVCDTAKKERGIK